MTSDLCSEDVEITDPQLLSSEAVEEGRAGPSHASVSGSTNRVQASSAAVELGRRLLYAARQGDTPAVLDLMARGAPFSTDWLGTSPLHLAAANANADTCAVLLRAGVSRDSRTKVERTPLHLAAYEGHAAIAQQLLDSGALVDAKDMLRMSPLHWAVERGHLELVSILLKHGADPHALSKFHKTPYSMAAQKHRDDMTKLMDDALKEREAARSVDALVNEGMADNNDLMDFEDDNALPAALATIIPTSKQPKTPEKAIKIEPKTWSEQKSTNSSGGGTSSSGTTTSGSTTSTTSSGGGAAALLRRHGITLLPNDEGSTVLSALQSGRTVVLSDAGKLVLKDSTDSQPGPSNKGVSSKGVVLTATPVRAPPDGVKVFTVNNKLLALPRDPGKPVRKIIDPSKLQRVKLVQVGSETRVMAARGGVKPKAKLQSPVKIIMNKANLAKLVPANIANIQALSASSPATEPTQTVTSSTTSTVTSPVTSCSGDVDSPRALRAQLAAARATIADLAAQLATAKAKLAKYERN